MRALHLLGLRRPGLQRLRYDAVAYEPLILPSWLPAGDREVLLAFYQQILGEQALPRIEVDWDYSLVPADASYLRYARLRHGAERDLIVVRVRRAGVDLADVVTPPEIATFQHVAIACDHPARNETAGRLRALAELVATTAQELYEELAEELALRGDGVALVEPLVRTLLNPIPVLETYNALIRVQGEPLAPEAHRDAVYRSVLGRLLDDLPEEQLVGLAALALRGPGGLTEALGTRGGDVEDLLRARMVLLDGRLSRWARFLEEPSLRGMVEDRIRRLAAPRRPIDGLRKVKGWLPEGRPPPSAGDPIREDVLAVFSWINEGKLGRAADTLASLERRLDEDQVTDVARGDFWDAVGRLRAAEGRWAESEAAFRRSLVLHERADAGPTNRAVTMDALARGLRDNGRWTEAEPLFREALLLMKAGGATATGVTTNELARGLRDNGHWTEAESLFRKALQLKDEGGATHRSRGITMDHLARGLRENGRWTEAEPLFRKALQLKEEGGDSPISRGATMLELARGLLQNGRPPEAEPLFLEAQRLLLAGDGNATEPRRAIVLRACAASLRTAGRLDDARRLDEEAAKFES